MSEATKKANQGLIHIYCGTGKGKTTASIGLACRAAGRGRKVIFCQFMKGSVTGEIAALESLGVIIVRAPASHGFLYKMTDEQKAEFEALQHSLFEHVFSAMSDPLDGEAPKLIVLDEVLDALSTGLISEEDMRKLLEAKPEETELVLTGRAAPEWLEKQAKYITEMKKIKHPWDEGIAAREGVEY